MDTIIQPTETSRLETSLGWKLPLNKEFRITQGFNGPYSHKVQPLKDLTYSVDFAVPVNTEVLASKEGFIENFYEEENKHYTGEDFKTGWLFVANQIRINHEDGTYSSYEHLLGDAFLLYEIYKGKRVKQGEPIGRTGLSGWIGANPHLHFSVYINVPHPKFPAPASVIKTIPFEFSDYKGSLWDKDLEKAILSKAK